MKINKMITIDMSLAVKLKEMKINVSGECNKALWRAVGGDVEPKSINFKEKIEELEKLKENVEKEETLKQRLKNAGISPKAQTFLKNMSLSMGAIKSNKESWKNITGKDISWDELKALKVKWS
jgi:hypothetical protein